MVVAEGITISSFDEVMKDGGCKFAFKHLDGNFARSHLSAYAVQPAHREYIGLPSKSIRTSGVVGCTPSPLPRGQVEKSGVRSGILARIGK